MCYSTPQIFILTFSELAEMMSYIIMILPHLIHCRMLHIIHPYVMLTWLFKNSFYVPLKNYIKIEIFFSSSWREKKLVRTNWYACFVSVVKIIVIVTLDWYTMNESGIEWFSYLLYAAYAVIIQLTVNINTGT